MLDATLYDFCREFYVVEKSVEVAVKINGQRSVFELMRSTGLTLEISTAPAPISKRKSQSSQRTPTMMRSSWEAEIRGSLGCL